MAAFVIFALAFNLALVSAAPALSPSFFAAAPAVKPVYDVFYPLPDGSDGGYLLVQAPESKNDEAVERNPAREAVVNAPGNNFHARVIPDDVNVEMMPTFGNAEAFVQSAPSMEQFTPPINSEVPKFTGSFIKNAEAPVVTIADEDRPKLNIAAITNPAAYFLEGAKLEKVKPASCRMIGCDGPIANDGDALFVNAKSGKANKACHQAFVPLNSCTNDKGYPVGMVCTICCDCADDFIAEMKNSRGFQEGFSLS